MPVLFFPNFDYEQMFFPELIPKSSLKIKKKEKKLPKYATVVNPGAQHPIFWGLYCLYLERGTDSLCHWRNEKNEITGQELLSSSQFIVLCLVMVYVPLKLVAVGPGEMAQWLRGHGFNFRDPRGGSQPSVDPIPGDLYRVTGTLPAPGMHAVPTYTAYIKYK